MENWYEEFLEVAKQAPQSTQQFEQSTRIKNAFEDDFVFSSPDAFVSTSGTNILRNELALYSKLGKSLVLIGPRRVGKTSAARFITMRLNKDAGDNFVQYIHYDRNFWDWWENTDFTDTKILFLDGILPIWNNLTKSSFDDLNSRSKYDRMIIVPIVDTIEYFWLSKRLNTVSPLIFDHEPWTINFPRPSESEIIQILKQRFKTIGISTPFPNKLLESLSYLSFRLPGLALWTTRHLLRSTHDQSKNRELTVDDLRKIIYLLNFGPGLQIVSEKNPKFVQNVGLSINMQTWPVIESLSAISSSLGQSLKQLKKITSSRLPILKEMLILDHIYGTIKRSELQERTGIKDSSLTYQCQNLVKDNLITYFKNGREVFYEIPSPTKEALELKFFK